MYDEFDVLRWNPRTSAFEREEVVNDSGMERHRERNEISYAPIASLSVPQLAAALAVVDGKEASLLVYTSRSTLDLFMYRRSPT